MAGYTGKLFSLDINDTLLLSRIVFTFAVFLLIYFFIFLLSRDKLAAISGAALILLADSVQSYYGLSKILQGVSPDDFLRIAKPVNPAMIYILFFGFLIAFWVYYQKPNWRNGIISAVLLGSNFYNYFYTWTYLYAFGGILTLFLLLNKKWNEALNIIYVFAGALLVAIPYVINLYQAKLHPGYEDAGIRFGLIDSRAPIFIGLVSLFALLIYLLKFPKDDKSNFYFGLALLLAPFITLNQQLITGKILQPAHYHWFFHKPIGVLLTLIVVFYYLSARNYLFLKKVLGLVIILSSFTIGIFVQAYSYSYGVRDGGNVAIERQKYGPVMAWLNNNAEKEEVVLANDESSHMVAIYTSLNLFYHRAAMYSLAASKQRLTEVLFTFYRFNGVGKNDARQFFFDDRANISANIYGMHYRESLGRYENIPDEKIEETLNLYDQVLNIPMETWFPQIMSKYEVKYIIWDKNSDPLWNLDKYNFLNKKADFNSISIYQFIS